MKITEYLQHGPFKNMIPYSQSSPFDRLTENPDLVFMMIQNNNKVLYRNVSNRIDINVEPIYITTTDFNVHNIDINTNMINNTIKNCNKLDNSIQYSDNI